MGPPIIRFNSANDHDVTKRAIIDVNSIVSEVDDNRAIIDVNSEVLKSQPFSDLCYL